MAARKSMRGAAAAPLLYWLLLVCGLAVLTVQRVDALDKVLPLWAGGLVGTAFGQFLAWRRLRLWLVLFLVANAMWCGAIVAAPFWLAMQPMVNTWEAVEMTVLSFAPAAICGYFSLSERAGPGAFWFPAVLWMLAILDRDAGSPLEGARGWLLLGGLGVLLIGFIHAREARRVALWQAHAPFPLAAASRRAVLRQAPLRSAAPAAWMAALGTAVLVLTGWIAPHLWHKDRIDAKAPGQAHATTATLPGTATTTGMAVSCCPDAPVVQVERSQVKEYFPVLHAREDRPPPAASVQCVACANGVPIKATGVGAPAGVDPPGPVSLTAAGPAAPGPVSPVHARNPSAATDTRAPPTPAEKPRQHAAAATVTPAAPPPLPPVAAATPRPAAPPPVAAPRPAAPPSQVAALAPPPPAMGAVARRPTVAAAAPAEEHPLEWLLSVVIAAVALHVALRPLRRIFTLRHLRRPFWTETVDQRVSNLWQLVLVGLRDAGWRTAPGEQPQELARRIGLDGLRTCATVLERARHGVRVDAADLEEMGRAAESAYQAARSRAGWAGRAVSWLRGPLV